jgi:hypothetical protein
MPNKDYDVAKRFQEVARRAGEINTAPKKKNARPDSIGTRRPTLENLKAFTSHGQFVSDEQKAYDTRPGRTMGPNSGKDVNLPIETASPEVRKRLADSLRKKR